MQVEVPDDIFHQHAFLHQYCKVCLKDADTLYHCGECMQGAYCSSECLERDASKHSLMCAARVRDGEEGEGGEEEGQRSKRARLMQEQEARLVTGADLPVEMVDRILGYLSLEDLKSTRLVDKLFDIQGGTELLRRIHFVVTEETLQDAEGYRKALDRLGPSITRLKYQVNVSIDFGQVFPNLQDLSLGPEFQQLLRVNTLPVTLRRLWIGTGYTKPIFVGVLPEGLFLLVIDHGHQEQLLPGSLPSTLNTFLLGRVEYELLPGVLPDGVETVLMDRVSGGFQPGTFPDSVLYMSVEGVLWPITAEWVPRRLTYLSISGSTFTPIARGALPTTLIQFILRGTYGPDVFQPGTLPSSLDVLELHTDYNRELTPDILPPYLKFLMLEHMYNQPLQQGVLPDTLGTLYLNPRFDHPLTRDNLPDDLRILVLNRADQEEMWQVDASYSHPYNDLPDSIEELTIQMNEHSIEELPENLRSLTLKVMMRPGNGDLDADVTGLETLRVITFDP